MYKFALKVNNKLYKVSGDNFVDTYKALVEKARGIKAKHINYEVNVISLTIPFKKPNKPKPAGRDIYWCPYCRAWHRYQWNDIMGLWQCPVCNISTRDYYVRHSNGGTENVPW